MQAVVGKALSYTALAKGLDTTRPTLDSWRRILGCPKGTDLDEWKKWLEENRKRLAGSKELRDEKTRHEIELLKGKIDRERGRTISREELNRVLFHASTRTNAILQQLFLTELAPKLDGMPAVQMRPILKESYASVIEALRDIFSNFTDGLAKEQNDGRS